MKKLMSILMLFIVVSFIGCAVQPSEFSGAKKAKDKITYEKDERTGLCFAFIASKKLFAFNQSGMGMACVECTEEVERLIKEGQ